MEDSKHEDGIRKAQEEISTWGVLRDLRKLYCQMK